MEIKTGKREVTSNGYFFTQGKMQVLLWHKWILLGKQKIEISKWNSHSEKIGFACYAVPSLTWGVDCVFVLLSLKMAPCLRAAWDPEWM